MYILHPFWQKYKQKGSAEMKKRTLSFKQYLKKFYGYKNGNDLYIKAQKKGLSRGSIMLIKNTIEDNYLAYCNEKNKKFSPLWY